MASIDNKDEGICSTMFNNQRTIYSSHEDEVHWDFNNIPVTLYLLKDC